MREDARGLLNLGIGLRPTGVEALSRLGKCVTAWREDAMVSATGQFGDLTRVASWWIQNRSRMLHTLAGRVRGGFTG